MCHGRRLSTDDAVERIAGASHAVLEAAEALAELWRGEPDEAAVDAAIDDLLALARRAAGAAKERAER